MLFHFEHMYIDHQPGKTCFNYKPWELTELKDILGGFMDYNQAHGGWDSLYLENHDQPRIVSRWANDGIYRDASAKMLALFHATGRGTLFIYQGQEIAMVNPSSWSFDELRDLEEIQYYETVKAQNGDLEDALSQIQRVGRDNSRTPMQWSAETGAGFTSGIPWIKLNEDYTEWNVEAQLVNEDDSVLGFWKKLLKIRKQHPALVTGTFKMLDYDNQNVYAYTRTGDNGQYLVVCSFADREVTWTSPFELGISLLGSYALEDGEDRKTMDLRPFEGRLYYLKS
jgi:oligo-1,6-glucosidase